MSLEKHIDDLIGKAIADGEFDNLENKGKPLNFDAYLSTPEDRRVGDALLKSNNFIPEEVDMLREIGQLREKIASMPEGEDKQALNKKLQEKSIALSLILERNKRRR